MIAGLRRLLREPRLAAVDLDSTEATRIHRRIQLAKPLLRQLDAELHRRCRELDRRHFGATPGRRVEIGAGASAAAGADGGPITSDVKILPFVDLVHSACRMPFADGSLRAVWGINVFHHLASAEAFFDELLRTLNPGGGAVLIEPYYGPLARWLYRRLHDSEVFDTRVPGWGNAGEAGPMSRANQALAYNVFVRDRERFDSRFAGLELVESRPHTQLWYLLSGGLNYRALVPRAMNGLVRLADRALAPADPVLALQHSLVLRKRPGKDTRGPAPEPAEPAVRRTEPERR